MDLFAKTEILHSWNKLNRTEILLKIHVMGILSFPASVEYEIFWLGFVRKLILRSLVVVSWSNSKKRVRYRHFKFSGEFSDESQPEKMKMMTTEK